MGRTDETVENLKKPVRRRPRRGLTGTNLLKEHGETPSCYTFSTVSVGFILDTFAPDKERMVLIEGEPSQFARVELWLNERAYFTAVIPSKIKL